MARKESHRRRASVWTVAAEQHGVIARRQLRALGLTEEAIDHRVEVGRLHPVCHGVFAVGRPEVSREGGWLAAVLSCGTDAFLSHHSAAALLGIADRESRIRVSRPMPSQCRRGDVKVHRLRVLPGDVIRHNGIPVTSPFRTILCLARTERPRHLEAAINAADRLDLIDPEGVRRELETRSGWPGVRVLRTLLDRHTFALTDSDLERRFLGLVETSGLPMPEVGVLLNGFKVDFLWRAARLIVETDGLRYHRTAEQQAHDRRRDQIHLQAGFETLRFTHDQVAHRPREVTEPLRTVLSRASRTARV